MYKDPVMKGIDVSKWQGVIDWPEVAKSDIDFAIIKAGGSDAGFYKDSHFETNYEGARAAGLHVGAYYFVGPKFLTTTDGIADAVRFLNIIHDKKFDMPICLDIESTLPSEKTGATDAAIAFCDYLEDAGYYVSIYASDISGFRDKLQIDRLRDYDKWVAKYSTAPPTYVPRYGLWQYSSTGKVIGISGNVDLDVAYMNYPQIIRNARLNRW